MSIPGLSRHLKAPRKFPDFLRAGQSFEAGVCSFQKEECPKGALFEMGKPGVGTFITL